MSAYNNYSTANPHRDNIARHIFFVSLHDVTHHSQGLKDIQTYIKQGSVRRDSLHRISQVFDGTLQVLQLVEAE